MLQASAVAENEPLHHVVLDISGASHMDTTAVEAVTEWQEGYAKSGIYLALVGPSPQIVNILHKAGCLNTGITVLCLLHVNVLQHDSILHFCWYESLWLADMQLQASVVMNLQRAAGHGKCHMQHCSHLLL